MVVFVNVHIMVSLGSKSIVAVLVGTSVDEPISSQTMSDKTNPPGLIAGLSSVTKYVPAGILLMISDSPSSSMKSSLPVPGMSVVKPKSVPPAGIVFFSIIIVPLPVFVKTHVAVSPSARFISTLSLSKFTVQTLGPGHAHKILVKSKPAGVFVSVTVYVSTSNTNSLDSPSSRLNKVGPGVISKSKSLNPDGTVCFCITIVPCWAIDTSFRAIIESTMKRNKQMVVLTICLIILYPRKA